MSQWTCLTSQPIADHEWSETGDKIKLKNKIILSIY
jgi:hypothetical protein